MYPSIGETLTNCIQSFRNILLQKLIIRHIYYLPDDRNLFIHGLQYMYMFWESKWKVSRDPGISSESPLKLN